MILNDSSSIVKSRQSTIRRELDRRGVSLKAIGFDAVIPYSTLLSYFPEEGAREPAMMPVSVLFKLVGVLPADLVSLLLPDGFAIVRVPEGIDYDDMEKHCRNFLAVKGEAHRADSPDGPSISACEEDRLEQAVIPFVRAA